MLEQSDHPLFVHVHIHKCAGTAFNELIRKTFAPRHLDAYIADPFHTYQRAELDDLVRQWPAVRSIASHSIRMFPECIGGRQPLYVCLLREPVDWFVSYLTYAQAHFDELTPEHAATFPPGAAKMPLGELADAMAQRFIARPAIYCTFIRYLAESAFRHALSGIMDVPPNDSPLTGKVAALFNESGLAMAQRILSRFFFVGIVERMNESIAALRRKLETVGIVLADEPVTERNVTRHRRDDLRWLEKDHPTGIAIRRLLADDLKLYEWARLRLHSAESS